MRRTVLLLAGLALAASSCRGTAPVAAASPTPVSVSVTRIDTTPHARRWTFTRTISDRTTVEQLYEEAAHLPTNHGSMACPAEFFVSYRLTFELSGGRRALVATVTPSGCDLATLSPGGKRWAAVGSGPSLLLHLRRALGLSTCGFTGLGEAGHPPTCHPVYG